MTRAAAVEPATDAEAVVICGMLAPWRLHQLAAKPGDAIREECQGHHGWAAGGWMAGACGSGISYEFSPGYGQDPTISGLITWKRITEIVSAASTPDLVAELGAALDAHQALSFLATKAMWAKQADPPEPSPIADQDAHDEENLRLVRLIRDLGEQIRDRIRNPLPLGQLDLFDLIGAS